MGVGGRIPSPGTRWELAICMREPPASSRRGSGTRGGDEAKPLLGTRGAPVGRRGEQAEGRQGHARAATRARARSVPPSPVFGNIDILGAPTWGEDPRRRGGKGVRRGGVGGCAAGIRPPPTPPRAPSPHSPPSRNHRCQHVDAMPGVDVFGGEDAASGGGLARDDAAAAARRRRRRARPVPHRRRPLPPWVGGAGSGRRASISTEHSCPCRKEKVVFFSKPHLFPRGTKPHLFPRGICPYQERARALGTGRRGGKTRAPWGDTVVPNARRPPKKMDGTPVRLIDDEHRH